MKDAFFRYHPIVNLLYFICVIGFGMFLMHPVCLVISMLCAVCYSALLKGKKGIRFTLCYMLPMLIVTALINPAFNHEGGTILLYLRDGNPLTLESIVYGVAAALMVMSSMIWFTCYNEIMTSDKFIYVFGRVIPALSLIISMALRFVPRFTSQMQVISNAQKCIGRDVSNGSVLQRMRHGFKIISILTTWALENAIETADSMNARGYGLPGRTAFSIYRFYQRDRYALSYLLCLGVYIMVGSLRKGLYFRYFPTIQGTAFNLYAVSLFIAYFLLCAMPIFLHVEEAWKWKVIVSKI